MLKGQLPKKTSVSAEHLFVEQLLVTPTSYNHAWKQMLGSELHPLKKEQLKMIPSVYAISVFITVVLLMALGCCTFMISFLSFTVG